ncbi:hypothetical protein [Mobiluncus curtisii]|uniref:hypothetical protein n=1 Tax=Mobiluncus curtisii TaxID=2051 RepID=UPI0014701CCD|nr:hypothetical protein [Mobiluncus curtisii]NMW88068.1 hypothetical protein [Mobiluncus curtisii]
MTRMAIANGGGNEVELPPASATHQAPLSSRPPLEVALHSPSGTLVALKNHQVPPAKIAKYQSKTLIGGTCGTCKQLLAHTRKANKYNIKTRIKKELANQVPNCHPDKAVVAHA